MSDVLCELLADFYRGDYVIEPVRKEIERLRAENERDRRMLTELNDECVKRRLEIERLRERLDKIAKHPDTTELIKQFAQGRIKAAEGEG